MRLHLSGWFKHFLFHTRNDLLDHTAMRNFDAMEGTAVDYSGIPEIELEMSGT